MDNFKKAFTLVELIIVVTIIAILWAIWFAAFTNNISDSRDATRKSDFSLIMSWLKNYKTNKWSYPIPSNYFPITNSGTVVVWQWTIDKNVWLSTLDEIPYDPQLQIPYTYSFTTNKQEYQLAATLENSDNEIALLKWDYKSIAKKILPNLILAIKSTSSIEINPWKTNGAQNRKLFVFDTLHDNLVYSFEENGNPKSNWTDFDTLLSEAENAWVFFQNTSFETCIEIKKAGKSIWNWEYQIRTSTWSLTNTWCTF